MKESRIIYVSDIGYTGVISGSKLTISNERGDMVFHTFYSAIKDFEQLKRLVDSYPYKDQ